jgi:aminomethyltransferase
VVRWDKGDFRGRAPLEREKETGPARLLAGLAFAGRQPGRDGAPVLRDGEQIGVVTSGNFSPTLGHAIAFAFLPPGVDLGTTVDVDVRGKLLPATVVPTPFVKH